MSKLLVLRQVQFQEGSYLGAVPYEQTDKFKFQEVCYLLAISVVSNFIILEQHYSERGHELL